MKNAEKGTLGQEQLAQLCSQIVSFLFCAENTIKEQKEKTQKKDKNTSVKTWSKLALRTGPSMLCNKFGPAFNTRIGHLFFFSFVYPLPSAGRMRFSKKNLDQF